MTPATQLFELLAASREANGGQLTRAQWIAAADKFFADCCVVRARAPHVAKDGKRARDAVFDALATSTGCRDLAKLTRPAARTIAVAAADIRAVSPSVTAKEIERVVEAYRARHPQWPCTATAIAKHWAEFVACSPTNGSKRDIYIEPLLWHGTAVQLFGDDIGAQMKDRGWRELDPATRAQILAKLT